MWELVEQQYISFIFFPDSFISFISGTVLTVEKMSLRVTHLAMMLHLDGQILNLNDYIQVNIYLHVNAFLYVNHYVKSYFWELCHGLNYGRILLYG